jgi:TP901 family phage tail tape measure protein
MALAAEALLRLKAVLDDEGFKKAQAALKGLDKQSQQTGGTVRGKLNKPLQAVSDGMQTIGKQATRAATVGLTTTGVGLAYSAVQASNFEDSLSDIKKALGLKNTSPEFAALSDDFLKLSRTIPVAAKDLAELGGMAALAGKDSRAEILKFASDAAKLGVAFRMPGREAAESLLAIQAQLGTTDQATLDLMGTVNKLSDVFPGKVDARDILKGFQSGLGGAGKMAGMTGEQTAGFYSAFLAAGTPADAAATSMKNFLNSLTSGTSLSNEKQAALGELYGMPVDPVRKQLQDELQQVNNNLVQFGGNARADAIERLIDDAKFQGKKLIEFEGQTLNFTQAGIIKKRLNEGTGEVAAGLKARKKAIEAQLKAMPSAGGMVAADLAKRMQADPVGTITDVLQRIKQLPKDRQVGLVNDIFGKESQLGIAAILSNIGLVKKGFDVAAQATQNADSWLKEYNSQLENTSSQFQLLKNAFNEMAIRIGTAMLPVLTQAMKDLTPTIIELIPVMVELAKAGLPLIVDGLKAALPYLQQFTAWAKANPEKLRGIVENTVKLGAGLIALGVAGGAIRNLVTVFGVLAGVGGKIGWLVNLPRTIAGTLGAVGPLLARLRGLFAGLFKKAPNIKGLLPPSTLQPINPTQPGLGGGFFSGVLAAARALPGQVMAALSGLPGMIAGLLGRIPGGAQAFQGLRTFIDTLRGFTPTMVMQGGEWVAPWTVRLATALRDILPVLALVGRTLLGIFTGPVGWVTLLVAAGAALYTFRGQIAQFVTTVAPNLAAAVQPLRDLLTGFASSIGGALADLGALLAPIWAQVSTLFTTYVVTPIQTVWNSLVIWIGQTVAAYAIVWWQSVVSGFNLYVVTPLQQNWAGLMNAMAIGTQQLGMVWTGISQSFISWVVVPVQQAWAGLTTYLGQGVANLRAVLGQAWAGVYQGFMFWVVQPITAGWYGLVQSFYGTTVGVRTALNGAWTGVAQGFNNWVVLPINQAWNALNTNIQNAWNGTIGFFRNAWSSVVGGIMNGVITPLQNMFTGVADRIRSVFDGLINWARGIGNWIVNTVNPVRQAAGFQPLQQLAKGGHVKGPTLALVGEGKDPGGEYIVPAKKMAQASMAYLAGARGADVIAGKIPGFAKGGFVAANGISRTGGSAASMPLGRGKARKNQILGMSATASSTQARLRALDAQFKAAFRGKRGATMADYLNYQMARMQITKQGFSGGRGMDLLGYNTNQILSPSKLESALGFATGGFVTRPTLGLIGEGRDSEYVLPSSKMAAASMAYLSGARGMGVVNPPRFANGGVVGPTQNRSANLNALMDRSGGLTAGSVIVEAPTVNATIEVNTGNVIQFEGEQYVSMADFQRGMRTVQEQTLAVMRTAAGRRATGR